MFFFTKQSIKGLPKKLRFAIDEAEKEPTKSKESEISNIVEKLSEAVNNKKFNRDDLPKIVNGKLYRDQTVERLIKMMPIFDQPTNNNISTLLQSTEREFYGSSTTLSSYLLTHQEAFNTLFSYIDDPKLFSVANIIIRDCVHDEQFLRYMFENQYFFSFIRFLTGNNFELLTSAYKTYEAMLVTNSDISSRYILQQYDIFSLQIKALLSSPSYLVQNLVLPVITKFITADGSKQILLNFVNDPENLCIIIHLLVSKSKRIKEAAYYLFKLFVINPRRNQEVRTVLRNNKVKLEKIIKKVPIPEDEEELIEERNTVIHNLSH